MITINSIACLYLKWRGQLDRVISMIILAENNEENDVKNDKEGKKSDSCATRKEKIGTRTVWKILFFFFSLKLQDGVPARLRMTEKGDVKRDLS